MTARCRALMVTAPASGQGKTSVTAAIARHHVRRGERVHVFKTGPDFLDPVLLARASGRPVQTLDLFMGGEAHCRALLHQAAQHADLLLIEGVMGLYDGDPSSAHLARAFGLPLLLVIDAGAMAQTFGALAHGLATYQPGLQVAGVVANRVAGDGHARMARDALPPAVPFAAALRREPTLSWPERHLGLVQASELSDVDARLDRWADAWAAGLHLEFSVPIAGFAPALAADAVPRELAGVTVAVARDAALSFIYPANVDCLRALGAHVTFFSPLDDAALPACDAVWLPGGYPELHAEALALNRGMAASLAAHVARGGPLLAECGGLMYAMESLTGTDGRVHRMAGLLPGHTVMQPRLVALGLQTVVLPEGALRGHTFHHSSLTTSLEPLVHASSPNGRSTAEAVYREGRLTASYVHLYFPSNPAAVAALFHPGPRP